MKSWRRLGFLVPVTEAVTSARREGTGSSSVTAQSQGGRLKAEEAAVSAPQVFGDLCSGTTKKITGISHALP